MKLVVKVRDICCEDMREALAVSAFSLILSAPRGAPVSLFDNRVRKPIKVCPYCTKEIAVPTGSVEMIYEDVPDRDEEAECPLRPALP
jgi:hypothetical protein